jgi:hypothetical protein
VQSSIEVGPFDYRGAVEADLLLVLKAYDYFVPQDYHLSRLFAGGRRYCSSGWERKHGEPENMSYYWILPQTDLNFMLVGLSGDGGRQRRDWNDRHASDASHEFSQRCGVTSLVLFTLQYGLENPAASIFRSRSPKSRGL